MYCSDFASWYRTRGDINLALVTVKRRIRVRDGIGDQTCGESLLTILGKGDQSKGSFLNTPAEAVAASTHRSHRQCGALLPARRGAARAWPPGWHPANSDRRPSTLVGSNLPIAWAGFQNGTLHEILPDVQRGAERDSEIPCPLKHGTGRGTTVVVRPSSVSGQPAEVGGRIPSEAHHPRSAYLDKDRLH